MTPGGDLVPRRTSSLTPRVSELAERVLDELAPLSRRVLLCDDVEGVAHVVKTYIEDEGLNVCVVHVTDGDEAQGRLQGERFDLLITDQAHPGLSGIDLCRASRSLHPSMPILMHSGTCECLISQWGDSPCWDRFLKKPWRPREFVRILQAILDLPD